MNDTEIIVAEIGLPVGVNELSAIVDAMMAVHRGDRLLIRQEGSLLRIFKPGSGGQEIAPGGYSKIIVKMQSELDASRRQLAAVAIAAKDGSETQEIAKGAYSWSPAYADVLTLRRDYENLLAAVQ